MTAQLAEPHHHHEDVRVVPQQLAPARVPPNDLRGLFVVQAVAQPLLLVQLDLPEDRDGQHEGHDQEPEEEPDLMRTVFGGSSTRRLPSGFLSVFCRLRQMASTSTCRGLPSSPHRKYTETIRR